MSELISDAVCAWCSAPRTTAPKCPQCGADYAKAAQIRRHGKAEIEPTASADTRRPAHGAGTLAESAAWHAGSTLAAGAAAHGAGTLATGADSPGTRFNALSAPATPAVSDPLLELRFCVAAIPLALLFGALFHWALPGLQRVFLTMPVHELGHAVTAWFCGHWAIPTLWKTMWSEERGVVVPLLLGGGLAWMAARAWRAGQLPTAMLGGVLLLVQATCTLGLKPATVSALITWGGDGTGLILATALMASFFFGKGTQWYRGSLRWGFLVIGAGAFADIFGSWWHARSDYDSIPFGENEGSGLTDPLVLLEQHHWRSGQIVQRYVLTGLCCLLALAVVYAWGVWQARQRLDGADGLAGAAPWPAAGGQP